MSPKSRSKRNGGGDCEGERGDVVASGEISNRSSALDESGENKRSPTTQHNYHEEHQPRQKSQQHQDLNKQYKTNEGSVAHATTNHNNNSSNTGGVDVLDEGYKRSRYTPQSSSANSFPNRPSNSYEDSAYNRPPIAHPPQPSVSSEQISPRHFNRHGTTPSVGVNYPPRTPPLVHIKENNIDSNNSGNRGGRYHSPSNLRGTPQPSVDENIANRIETSEIASERSGSVGPLVIAEEDCSSTTPGSAYHPDDRNIRHESSSHDSHLPTQSFGSIPNNNTPINSPRFSVPYDRKRTYNDISMDRYSGSTTPGSGSHFSSRHRSPPSLSPHRSNRSQHHSRESTHSVHSMQRPMDLPPPSGSPPPPMNLPPLPPLSIRASTATTLSPTTGVENERGRAHSRPSSWSNQGRSR